MVSAGSRTWSTLAIFFVNSKVLLHNLKIFIRLALRRKTLVTDFAPMREEREKVGERERGAERKRGREKERKTGREKEREREGER